MKKMITLLFHCSLLIGCSSKPLESTISTIPEEALIRSGNTERLVEFYKEELRKKDSDSTRLKLVDVYFDSSDYENADFHLGQLKDKSNSYYFKKSKLLYVQGHLEKAIELANKVTIPFDDESKLLNLKGIIYYELGDEANSEKYFLLSRKALIDDWVFINNQAFIDLTKGNYSACIQKLEPIWVQSELDSAKANLGFCYAKSGELKRFHHLYQDLGDSEVIYQTYKYLRDLE